MIMAARSSLTVVEAAEVVLVPHVALPAVAAGLRLGRRAPATGAEEQVALDPRVAGAAAAVADADDFVVVDVVHHGRSAPPLLRPATAGSRRSARGRAPRRTPGSP